MKEHDVSPILLANDKVFTPLSKADPSNLSIRRVVTYLPAYLSSSYWKGFALVVRRPFGPFLWAPAMKAGLGISPLEHRILGSGRIN